MRLEKGLRTAFGRAIAARFELESEDKVNQTETAPLASAQTYDAAAVESKWARLWEERGTNRFDVQNAKDPFYNLVMFPYPTAEKLHIGHAYTYGGLDTFGRYWRMRGKDVFEPMGWDAFGINAENYAFKVNRQPAELIAESTENFKKQMNRLGLMIDWNYELDTSKPEYYRWTQWIFLKLHQAGLVEQREGPVNWCPSCMTVLADEQVEGGLCERCDSKVETKQLKQWFIRITDYAQKMLDATGDLDWPESTKLAQVNWIGRSEGAQITFKLEGCSKTSVNVFTTRPDTLYGATFLVIGADHPDIVDFAAPARRAAIEAWRTGLPPTGSEPDFAFGTNLGSVAVHPLTGARIPVWAAPYVLGSYGTGAIMAVPAHDERDWQFAKAHRLQIVEVIAGGNVAEAPYSGAGVLVNSKEFDGFNSVDGAEKITAHLVEKGIGESRVQFRIRDWLVSRQRYWGAPIPMIHCPTDGAVPVPEAELPVVLPEMADFKPVGTGVSPLATVADWVNVKCPKCGGAAKRETDVLDTFVDSSWYFLRYPSVGNDKVAFDAELTSKWSPVHSYIGGQEHAARHLIYARFVNRALHEQGLLPAAEPFTRFRNNGLLIKDGAKISKSRGNVVNPDEYLDTVGADTLRCYLMFLGPFSEGGDWRDDGIKGLSRFLARVWQTVPKATSTKNDKDRERMRHRVIKGVTEDIPELRYNTALAKLMEFSHQLESNDARKEEAETMVQLLAPFAPHLCEELWEGLGHTESVFDSTWPAFDPDLAKASRVTIAVQINGKTRATFDVDAGTGEDELRKLALEQPKIVEMLTGNQPTNVVVVVDKIVNLVV